MKKALFTFLACGTIAASTLSFCSATNESIDYPWDFAKKTTKIDDIKVTECVNKGTVETLDYDCPAYAINDLFGVNETIHKKVNVYLPYGYDETQEYNVLYLLHGTRGASDPEDMADFWLTGPQWGNATCNLLDNMIDSNLCDPVIVVTPSYYAEVDGYEITTKELDALAEKLGGDNYINPAEAEDGGEPDNVQNVWPNYFGSELRNDIIPLIESTYSTYATRNTDVENLITTRDHRALAGFSRGSMTVTRSGMMQNTDIISYFGNYSGIWAEFDQFKSVMENDYADYDIKFWFNGNGKSDFALNNHTEFVERAMTEMSDKFIDGENYAWVTVKDGAHMYKAWTVDLYDSLLVFFK